MDICPEAGMVAKGAGDFNAPNHISTTDSSWYNLIKRKQLFHYCRRAMMVFLQGILASAGILASSLISALCLVIVDLMCPPMVALWVIGSSLGKRRDLQTPGRIKSHSWSQVFGWVNPWHWRCTFSYLDGSQKASFSLKRTNPQIYKMLS